MLLVFGERPVLLVPPFVDGSPLCAERELGDVDSLDETWDALDELESGLGTGGLDLELALCLSLCPVLYLCLSPLLGLLLCPLLGLRLSLCPLAEQPERREQQAAVSDQVLVVGWAVLEEVLVVGS